jgi:apolipoprotein D and lipocalin family protein
MRRLPSVLLLLALLTGCATMPSDPLPTARDVDLGRFMGDWYVIAHIPTIIEKQAYNAIERYDLEPDGTIATTFTFRKGGFDGEPKKYTPTGFVRDPVHRSTWGMQFVWPVKAEFLISHLDAGYTQTIIARNARDYVWIMARTPTIPDADYERLVAQVAAWGYDTGKLRKVPQRW